MRRGTRNIVFTLSVRCKAVTADVLNNVICQLGDDLLPSVTGGN